MDYTDKRITIMGLGIAGGAVEDALFFIRRGARVTVTDVKDEQDLLPSLERLEGQEVVLHLGGHRKEDFTEADLIIKNPGVPDNSEFLAYAKQAGVPIEMGSGIFAKEADMSKVVGITGTKGKSTTTALAHRIVQIKYPDAYHGGDVDGSPLKFVDQSKAGAWGVMELSSWRLEGMAPHKKSPHIAVITNIAQDHLNRYESYDAYREAKKIIFRFQSADDIAVLNYDDAYLRQSAPEVPGRILWFSTSQKPHSDIGEAGCYIEKGMVHMGAEAFTYADLKTKTKHHPANIAAALTVAMIFAIPLEQARRAVEEFEGLFGRLQLVAEVGGTSFYNDTAATNPYAARMSIQALGIQKLALIVGGEDKNMDYGELASALKNVPHVFVLPGTASDKLMDEADKLELSHLQRVHTLEEAVKASYEARPQAVLFSPAAASFNMFKNEFDRGEKFIEAVKALK